MAYHDDEGDGSDETPYEVVVHAKPAPGTRRHNTTSNKAKPNDLISGGPNSSSHVIRRKLILGLPRRGSLPSICNLGRI